MCHPAVVIAVAVLGLARAGHAAPSDAFLDRTLPADARAETRTASAEFVKDPAYRSIIVLGYTSFWSGVQLLGTLAGKPMRMPAALAEWPDERTEKSFRREVAAKPGEPTRTIFDALYRNLNLVWSYDAAVDLRPAWWRDDPRPGKELLDDRPADPETLPWKPEPWPYLGRPARDSRRLALDALLSRPENFAQAGALRLCHDQHGLRKALRLSGALAVVGRGRLVRPGRAAHPIKRQLRFWQQG